MSSFASVNQLLVMVARLPLVSGIGLLLAPRGIQALSPVLALWSSGIAFVAGVMVWMLFDSSTAVYQMGTVLDWMVDVNASFGLGIDGLSLFFVLLNRLLTPLCILASMAGITHQQKYYYGLFLVLESFVNIVFRATDLFTFYIFFEAVLIPMFYVIGVWGSRSRKVRAAYFFFRYTLVGSVFMLLALRWLYSVMGTMDTVSLAYGSSAFIADQRWLWVAFFLSFAVKVPMMPVHIWLPEAHVEAPTAGSVILAGILLKLGTYGMMRFLVGLFAVATVFFVPVVYALSLRAIVYTSRTAIRQSDMKRVIAYASVAHMNMTLVGLFSLTPQGVDGALLQMISHGLVSGALFLCVGVLYDQHHSRMVAYYGGVAQTMPVFTALFRFFTMANIALPGTSSFVGEFMILVGIFQTNTFVALVSATGMVLGGAYSLWLFNRVVYANLKLQFTGVGLDVNARELATFMPLVLLTLWLGIAPGFLLDAVRVSTSNRIEFVRSSVIAVDNASVLALAAVATVSGHSGNTKSSSVGLAGRETSTYYVGGCPLRGNKPIYHELVRIKGVGASLAHRLCSRLNVNPLAPVSKVSSVLPQMEKCLEDWGYPVGAELKRAVVSRISFHMTAGTRRGIRIRSGLPVRGQRTSTNASTASRLNARLVS